MIATRQQLLNNHSYFLVVLYTGNINSSYFYRKLFFLLLSLWMPINKDAFIVLDGSGEYYYCFGNNRNLGVGHSRVVEQLTKVDLPEKFQCIVVGEEDHSVGISALDGALWSWGSNNKGQCGLPLEIRQILHPEKIPNTSNFIQIAVGFQFTLALDVNGSVWSFGVNYCGQLGQGDPAHRGYPTIIETLTNIRMVSAGSFFGIVLDSYGDLWSFGNNPEGQLGHGDCNDRHSPTKIATDKKFTQISSGFSHVISLDTEACVWGFGCNTSGQLGLGNCASQRVPTSIPALNNIIEVSCGGNSTCAKDQDGHVYKFGNLYTHKMAPSNTRTPTKEPAYFGKDIFLGGDHLILLDDDRNMYFFGSFSSLPDDFPIGCPILVDLRRKHCFSTTKRATSE
jgi:alpha-tubulin suppressor-like RCC1 family protein